MFLLNIAIGSLLITCIQPVEGSKRATDEDWVESYFTDTSENGIDYVYNVDKKNSNYSFDQALGNVTSNTWITLMTDAQLSSVIQLVGLTNISIIGYNDPTVNCNLGGFHFVSSYTIMIRGIVWEGCGVNSNDNTHPVLQLHNSSNITIENCSFQHSVGQAVVLSDVSGDVKINDCKFLFNTQFNGHGAAIFYLSNSFYELNFTITRSAFYNNKGTKSIVYFGQSSTMPNEYSILIHNSNFSHNKGVPLYLSNTNLSFSGNNAFYGNAACNGAGIVISDHSNVSFHKRAIVNFRDNAANSNGGAIYLINHSSILFNNMSNYYTTPLSDIDNLKQMHIFATFDNNKASESGGAIFSHNSNVVFGKGASIIFKENVLSYSGIGGGALYIDHRSTVTFEMYSTVTFNKNSVRNSGGAVYIDRNSTVFFKNATVELNNNDANLGGAVFINSNSSVIFGDNCAVTFSNNKATKGGATYNYYSTVTFKGTSTVHFHSNDAYHGGVMFLFNTSIVTFTENTEVEFNNNVGFNGGVVYMNNHSIAVFEGKCIVKFDNNKASHGAIYTESSRVTFEGDSNVTFSDTDATQGAHGALYMSYSNFTFKGYTTVTFNNNRANSGGAAYIYYYSNATFKENSVVTFVNNKAINNGGALYIVYNATILFEGNSTVTFNKNEADFGGAIYIRYKSTIIFDEYAKVKFSDNQAFNGGALYHYKIVYILVQGNSTVMFSTNSATQSGGALYLYRNCSTLLTAESKVVFIHNTALQGGAIYCRSNSQVKFMKECTANFTKNEAIQDGGVMYFFMEVVVTFDNHARILFHSNNAKSGGAVYSDNGVMIAKGESNITFNNNTAKTGGAVITEASRIIFSESSHIKFINNTALQDGGAIYLNDRSHYILNNSTNVRYFYNTASDYGEAIYIQLEDSSITINIIDDEVNNTTVGNTKESVYINVPSSCDHNCLHRSVKSINQNSSFLTTTSPSKLILYSSAKCIKHNNTECTAYYIDNIMLGQEITFDACVLDYYNQPTTAAQFLVNGMDHENYSISGSRYLTISCNHTTHGFSIIGSADNPYNYSVNISLYVARISETKIISANLMIGLSNCHSGFRHLNESQKCECYDTKNLISCSGNNSTIKKGYWFGYVTGKPTVASCPDNYCNFTCCEATNGMYHLSPIRKNQCRLHRSGIACGNCEKGYTLSFDLAECVEITKCTLGQGILVSVLSLLYWIAVVVTVFVMMHSKVLIGSLYGIVYYYSIVDIMLSQEYFISNELYTAVTIMSSLAKLTPQFLGQLCLVRNMSGIDQQFIHYIHPTVVSVVLIIICVLARKSPRVSSFVSKGAIHFICFLLLLSYTSVTTTSLLLMRLLTFTDIDKVYTYLSPDIEYCHGRHLAYVIVTVIFTITIVIGLPLLLLLEPFLNSKINFVKLKPLLDQFQGCYKDKYRCFAAYYMICRILIIVLIIVRISDDFTTQYLLISACSLMALIHLIVRPYINTIHNTFDGVILHLMVIICVLPLVEFADSYNQTLVTMITYLIIFLPLAGFIAIKLFIHRSMIKDAKKYCCNICSRQFYYEKIPTDDPEVPEIENGITVDHGVKKSIIIVTM